MTITNTHTHFILHMRSEEMFASVNYEQAYLLRSKSEVKIYQNRTERQILNFSPVISFLLHRSQKGPRKPT